MVANPQTRSLLYKYAEYRNMAKKEFQKLNKLLEKDCPEIGKLLMSMGTTCDIKMQTFLQECSRSSPACAAFPLAGNVPVQVCTN